MRNPHNEPLTDIRDGRKPVRHKADGPERRCILGGGTASRDALVRLAVSPDGLVLPDAQARAPGRGAWIGVTRAELENALADGKLKGALSRAFKTGKLEIPDDLAERIEQALRQAVLQRLGLELRSGKLLLGSDRIAEQARMGKVALLCHAADAAPDGNRRLDQAWRVGMEREGSGEGGLLLPLDRAALSVALGRENVVHLALADAHSAERVLQPLRRLLHFTGPAAPADEEAEAASRTGAASSGAAAQDVTTEREYEG